MGIICGIVDEWHFIQSKWNGADTGTVVSIHCDEQPTDDNDEDVTSEDANNTDAVNEGEEDDNIAL